MRTLPYDYHRCQAYAPDSNCKRCLRWSDLPGQTWGPRSPCVGRANSTDEDCTYIPIEQQKNDFQKP